MRALRVGVGVLVGIRIRPLVACDGVFRSDLARAPCLGTLDGRRIAARAIRRLGPAGPDGPGDSCGISAMGERAQPGANVLPGGRFPFAATGTLAAWM